MIDDKKIDEMMRIASANNVDEQTVKRMLGNLSESEKQKVNDILSDKERLNKILSNSAVSSLLKKFSNRDG